MSLDRAGETWSESTSRKCCWDCDVKNISPDVRVFPTSRRVTHASNSPTLLDRQAPQRKGMAAWPLPFPAQSAVCSSSSSKWNLPVRSLARLPIHRRVLILSLRDFAHPVPQSTTQAGSRPAILPRSRRRWGKVWSRTPKTPSSRLSTGGGGGVKPLTSAKESASQSLTHSRPCPRLPPPLFAHMHIPGGRANPKWPPRVSVPPSFPERGGGESEEKRREGGRAKLKSNQTLCTVQFENAWIWISESDGLSIFLNFIFIFHSIPFGGLIGR